MRYVYINSCEHVTIVLIIIPGVDHPQGQGQIWIQSCEVIFNVFVPKDMDITPYIIWISHGRHSHPPPPPTRSPQQYVTEILSILRRINDPSLTTGTILFTSYLKYFS